MTQINFLGGGGVTTEETTVINNVNNYYTEVNQSTGFVNTSDSSKSFNDTNRTFTITPTGDSFSFWIFGTRYEKIEAESVQIDNVAGLWYIYYGSDGVLGASQIIWDLSTQLPVAVVSWDTTTGVVEEPVNNKNKTNKLLNIYVLSVFVPGTLTNEQLLLFHSISGSESVELAKRLPYSSIKCVTAPTAEAVFDIKINDESSGSAIIAIGQNTGTFEWGSKVTLSGGDTIKIIGPAIADVAMADVGFTIQGIRV